MSTDSLTNALDELARGNMADAQVWALIAITERLDGIKELDDSLGILDMSVCSVADAVRGL